MTKYRTKTTYGRKFVWLDVSRVTIHSGSGDMTAGDWIRNLRNHLLNHRRNAEKSNWMWGTAIIIIAPSVKQFL